jgi:hypothetical protein
MVIIGSFIVYKSRNTIRNMKIGDSGFVFLDRAFLSKKYFIIHLDTEVFSSKKEILELSRDGLFPYAKITKMGRKNISSSFDINVSIDENIGQFDFPYVDIYHMKKKVEDTYNYLSFKNPPIIYNYIDEYDLSDIEEQEIIDGLERENGYFEDVFNVSSLTDLKKKLKVAVENEDYELAAKIRDKIEKLKKSG